MIKFKCVVDELQGVCEGGLCRCLFTVI